MLDGNITEEAIDHACHFCAANHIPGTWHSSPLFRPRMYRVAVDRRLYQVEITSPTN